VKPPWNGLRGLSRVWLLRLPAAATTEAGRTANPMRVVCAPVVLLENGTEEVKS
jgi:hypothetical protein